MTDVTQQSKKTKELSELAQRIRKARKTAHLSQHDLGASVGVSDKSVSAYEQGRSVPPISKLKKIADATQHPLSFFTQENVDEATITAKLLSIERELTEVRKLLKEKKK
ncbi:MAG: helix-turn-helix transcriptional regulator [Patescibacteria group bacterium]